MGECNENDIDEINKLELTNTKCDQPDFESAPWCNAILVTPRHSVREEWNSYALVKHCRLNKKVRYIVPAEDTEREQDTEPSLAARLATAGLKEKSTGKLHDVIEVAVGMKAMVLVNIAVEAEVANGTRGTVEQILLDPREEIRSRRWRDTTDIPTSNDSLPT